MTQRRPFSRLWVRLMLAFGGVLILAILLPTLYARQVARSRFQEFLTQGQRARQVNLAAALALLYRSNGDSWSGTQERAAAFGQVTSERIVITDRGGVVVGDSTGQLLGSSFRGGAGWVQTPIVDPPARRGGLATRVGGALPVVGTLYLQPPAGVLERDAFLRDIQRALLFGALVALLAALLLSFVLARRIGGPLEQLTAAAQRMGEGDLTQRVRVEGNDEVADLARGFNVMAEKLATSQTLRRQLVADIAHELRTPLANIRGYLEAIEDGVVAADDQTLGTLRDESARLNHLIEDLQDLAQAEAGALRLHREPSDLAELIDRALSGVRATASERHIELVAETPDDLPPVTLDRQRIAQALANLLTNALAHTPAGGRITVSAARVGAGAIAVRVADTGAGISPEDLPHIFERFFRADRSRARATGGSGLGLTIARQLIESHGGTIAAVSTVGSGSTFTFTLPITRSAQDV